jgi:hypothetical protein
LEGFLPYGEVRPQELRTLQAGLLPPIHPLCAYQRSINGLQDDKQIRNVFKKTNRGLRLAAQKRLFN